VTRLRIHNQETGIPFATDADIFLFSIASRLIPHIRGTDGPFPGAKQLGRKAGLFSPFNTEVAITCNYIVFLHTSPPQLFKTSTLQWTRCYHLRNIPTWSSQHSANLSQLVLTCSVFARLNSRRRWNEEPKWRRAAKKVACCTWSAVIVSVPWTWWGCVHTNNEVSSRINTNK